MTAFLFSHPAGDFESVYRLKRDLVLLRVFAGRFAELLEWEELVSMLDGHRADLAGRLRLVQNGRTLSQEQIALPAGRSLVGGLTRLSTARINELCAGGASLVLSGVRDYSRRIDDFAAQLEVQLRAPVGVNAYLTPAGNRAFGVHDDPYDIFILQILGQKDWRLYGRRAPTPLRDERADFSNAPEHPEEELTLRAGDALYVPRGFWHAASTSPENGSLHLTLGVRCPTYADVLDWITGKLRSTEPARAKLPLPFGPAGGATAAQSAIEELLRQAAALVPQALQELESHLGAADPGFALYAHGGGVIARLARRGQLGLDVGGDARHHAEVIGVETVDRRFRARERLRV